MIHEPVKYLGLRRILIFAAGAACLVAGYLNGGMADVLHKAILICYECIGIG